MKYVSEIRSSLYKFISSIGILNKIMEYIDYALYFFVTLSFLGKLAFLNFYLNNFFSIIFLVIMIISFAAGKNVNIVVLFFNNIILYILELISIIMNEFIFFNEGFIQDIFFKDIFMLSLNIIFFNVCLFLFKKYNSNFCKN